jgi:hypothetical protein
MQENDTVKGNTKPKKTYLVGADDFIPLLIYTVLKAKITNLCSNIE